MKVLSVRQPWAWAIVDGWKDVENRSWTTRYRGPIAIHAGRTPAVQGWQELDRLEVPHPFADELSWGAIIGIAHLVEVIDGSSSPWAHPGQWHWVLQSPRWLATPLTWRGQVGLVNAPVHVVDRVQRMAAAQPEG